VSVVVIGGLAVAVGLRCAGARALSPGASAVRPVVVVRGGGSNEGPVEADGWFGWMHSSTVNPIPPISHTSVYVRHGHGPSWRVNPPGSYAETGGISNGSMVIQLITQGSALAAVNLATRKLRVLPRPFNAEHRYEWRPSLSGRWLLYGSINFADQRYSVVLANLQTRELRTLGSAQGHAAYAAPGQVDGRYATWITCPDNHCIAYRYDIDTKTTIQMPPIGGAAYWHFGPSVTADGAVYFGVGHGCADVRLIRWRDGHAATIYRFPAGTAFLYSYTAHTTPPTIYYDNVACNPHALSRIDAIRDTTP
jgi:hypothetical protein